MLKGNLSSRPFYNERLVSAALVLIAALALALTAFNGSKLYTLSTQRSERHWRLISRRRRERVHGTVSQCGCRCRAERAHGQSNRGRI